MITKDINGNNLPSSYDDIIKSDDREFLCKILKNGVELNADIQRIEISKGSIGDVSQFNVGSIISSGLTATLYNLQDEVKNQWVEVQVGLLINNDYVYIDVGTFFITEVKTTKYVSTLTGFGKLVGDTGIKFIEPELPLTIQKISDQIATQLNCSIIWDSSIDLSQTIDDTMTLSGLTVYQVVKLLATIIGGYVIELEDGNIKFCIYKDTTTHQVKSELMTSLPELEEKDFEITGVTCIVTEASGDIPATGYTQGDPVNLIFNSEYITENIFNNTATNLIGYTYRTGKINLSMGDPRITGEDVLEVIDPDDSSYVVPCHKITHIYDGGFRSLIDSAIATNLENNIGTIYPIQRQIDDINKEIVQVENDIKVINEDLQYFWHDRTGAHVSSIPKGLYRQEPCYETLIRSDKIIMQYTGTNFDNPFITVDRDGLLLNQSGSEFKGGSIKLGNFLSMSINGFFFNNNPVYIDASSTEQYTWTMQNGYFLGRMLGPGEFEVSITLPFIAGQTGIELEVDECRLDIFKMDGSKVLQSRNQNFITLANTTVYLESAEGTNATLFIQRTGDGFKWYAPGTIINPETPTTFESLNVKINQLTFKNTI